MTLYPVDAPADYDPETGEYYTTAKIKHYWLEPMAETELWDCND